MTHRARADRKGLRKGGRSCLAMPPLSCFNWRVMPSHAATGTDRRWGPARSMSAYSRSMSAYQSRSYQSGRAICLTLTRAVAWRSGVR